MKSYSFAEKKAHVQKFLAEKQYDPTLTRNSYAIENGIPKTNFYRWFETKFFEADSDLDHKKRDRHPKYPNSELKMVEFIDECQNLGLVLDQAMIHEKFKVYVKEDYNNELNFATVR